jgi:hypothetical protein
MMTISLRQDGSRRSRCLAAVLAVLLLAATREARSDETSITLEVATPKHALRQTPVEFVLPAALRQARHLQLTRVGDDRPIALQRAAGDEGRVMWIVDETPAGESRRFQLRAADAPRDESPRESAASVQQQDGRITLLVGKRPVLVYHAAVAQPPDPLDAAYRRSGFLHPVYTPDGRVLTDDFPPDHAHQHGVFFAWVNTSHAGHAVDFWNQLQKTGTVEHVALEQVIEGPVFAQLQARLRHLDLTFPEPRAVLEETWTIRVYNIAEPFVIDFESRQTCAGKEPLVVNKYHYGGMALRGNRAWLDEQAKGVAPAGERNAFSDFVTSEGRGRADGNHTRPRWVDLFGKLDERFCGLALLSHPQNFNFPQPVRLHPSKPYFCFSPMVEEGFTIAPGGEYLSRYRLVAHNGSPERDQLDRCWREYAGPPAVREVD